MTTSRITCEVARTEHARLSARQPPRDDIGRAVHRAAAGDPRAWTLLIGRFDATVRNVARRHGLCEADRDEVAQRTWLALVRHIGRLGDHPALGGWLAVTARRECLQVLAAGRREIAVDDTSVMEASDDPPPEDRLVLEERRAALHQAIDRAPEHQRKLLRLLLSEPAMSYDQVSALLGIPKGSIGPTRGRCLARLRGDREFVRVVRGRPVPGHDLA